MEYSEFVKKMGLNIKRIRTEKGITQEEMDQEPDGISYRTVQDIENGKSHASIRSLFKISQKLGVSVRDLVDVEE